MVPTVLVVLVVHFVCIRGQRQNPPCEPQPTVLPVDPPWHRYFPYFVELHRCAGSCGAVTPAIQGCTTEVVSDYNLAVLNVRTFERRTLTLKNHTSCTCSCVKQESDCDPQLETWDAERCRCNCKYTREAPPTPCEYNLEWNRDLCRCACDRPPDLCEVRNQEWNKEVCGCACREWVLKLCMRKQQILDPKTCECVDLPPDVSPTAGKRTGDDGIDRRVFIGTLLAEFFILVLAFDLYLFFKYNMGVIHAVSRKCCPPRPQGKRNGETPQNHQQPSEDQLLKNLENQNGNRC